MYWPTVSQANAFRYWTFAFVVSESEAYVSQQMYIFIGYTIFKMQSWVRVRADSRGLG